MAASSSAAAAADSRPPKYDVFISFRGEDTRKGFTSHLYSALCGKQIKAYIDEASLEKGDTISRALPEAINESEISIIIFSENYGESLWCLYELERILERREKNDQIVLPIFYNIDPSHIRNQKETYAAAFVKHEERFKDEMEQVQKWRQALKNAAAISGWNSLDMYESDLVKEVAERVRTELDTIKSKRSDDLEGLVGIPKRLEKIKSFLDSPTVRNVGIWGMGGIGKTTLAELVFKQFYNGFECSYFAHNVRENAIKKGLDALKKEVFSELLGEKNVDILKSDVNDRLSRTKALLVLDDVKNPMQLKRLVGDRERFGPGSKIIATSRHKLMVDEEYEVEVLDFNDACKLFYLNAFREKSCRRGYEEISYRVVEYTKGHPLALQVLGAVFNSLESIEDWEKELKKLKRIPNDEILEVLEISYDALDAEEKGLFLDIACFFKGERRDFVEGILEDKPIAGLVNKSLITIDRHGLIHMHDLIQDMGRVIVLRSTQRSRFWIAKDVSDALENNKGSEAIEGIYLPSIKEEIHLRPDVFEEMSKLRLLKFYTPPGTVKVFIDGDLTYLPNGLRYLHWQNYPGKSLPSNFNPQYLVELNMPNSKLEQLWDGVQKLGSLKHIGLFNSKLTKLPDLSLAPKLERINLSLCDSLIHIPSLNLNLQAALDESAYRHQWLRYGSKVYSYPFDTIPGCINLDGCKSLTTLPKVSGNIRRLVLRETALEELPSSIESLENLLLLDLELCYNLRSLPKLPRNIEVLILDNSGIKQIPSSSIECLCSLRILSLRYCSSFESLPSNINLKALEQLNLKGTSIQELPSTIDNSIKLQRLNLGLCEHLEFIPNTLCKLTRLQKLSLRGCSNLGSLPILTGLCFLTSLNLSDCNIREIPASIGMLYNLKWLDISNCKNLQSLPELPLFVESVNAEHCSSLEMVSTLRSTLTLGRWLDKFDSGPYTYPREFSFLDCTKLGEDAINNIFREFLYRVFCTATTPQEVVDPAAQRVIRELVVCYPTKEIPKWFNNQSDGSSITITLPPNWYNRKTFLGFVISVVVGHGEGKGAEEEEEELREVEGEGEGEEEAREVEVEGEGEGGDEYEEEEEEEGEEVEGEGGDEYEYEYEEEEEEVEGEGEGEEKDGAVQCKLHLMTNKDRFTIYLADYRVESCLDHIVMWYKYFDHSQAKFEKYQEASLEIYTELKVKRCGVRMLYLKDAVEESDDGSTANFESWRTDVMDSNTDYATTYDSDEPPPKRTRNL